MWHPTKILEQAVIYFRLTIEQFRTARTLRLVLLQLSRYLRYHPAVQLSIDILSAELSLFSEPSSVTGYVLAIPDRIVIMRRLQKQSKHILNCRGHRAHGPWHRGSCRVRRRKSCWTKLIVQFVSTILLKDSHDHQHSVKESWQQALVRVTSFVQWAMTVALCKYDTLCKEMSDSGRSGNDLRMTLSGCVNIRVPAQGVQL